MNGLFLILILVSSLWTARADEPFRPFSIVELGFTHQQRAYRVEGNLVWMDSDALRRDFPTLVGLQDEEIEDWILSNFSYVTDIQAGLSGTVITPFQVDRSDARFVYHPLGYVRASVAPFLRPGTNEMLGLVDLKGSGFSPEGLSTVSEYFDPIGKLENPNSITDEDLSTAELRKRQAEARLQEARAELTECHEAHRNSIQHQIRLQEQTVHVFDLLAGLYRKVLKKKRITPSDITTYLRALGRRDYTNGVAPLSRLVKEIVVQKAAQRLMEEHNAQHGTHFQTIDHYFLIELPFLCDSPSGEKQPAGIVGRQAHWRFRNTADLVYPDSLPIRDTIGREQGSVFGALTDFENVAIDDPRVSNILGPKSRRIDQVSDRAVLVRPSKKRESITLVIQDSQDKIPSTTHPPLNERSDPAATLFRRVNQSESSVPHSDLFSFAQTEESQGVFLAVMSLLAHRRPDVWSSLVNEITGAKTPGINVLILQTAFALLHSRPDLYVRILERLAALTHARNKDTDLIERLHKKPEDDHPQMLHIELASIHAFELARREAERLGVRIPLFWLKTPVHLQFMMMIYDIHTGIAPAVTRDLFLDTLKENGIEDPKARQAFDYAAKVFTAQLTEPLPTLFPTQHAVCATALKPKRTLFSRLLDLVR